MCPVVAMPSYPAAAACWSRCEIPWRWRTPSLTSRRALLVERQSERRRAWMCGRAFRSQASSRRHVRPIGTPLNAPKVDIEKRFRIMHVLVTGAGGFIGAAAVSEFARRGHRVRALSTRDLDFGPGVECIRV